MAPGGTDHPIGSELEVWAAQQVVRQHAEPPSPDRATGRCAQCQPDGSCVLLAWARGIVE